ncbi:unnamed protein product [Aphanomyces euteiches]|uniref:Uricase n=1 Tax=Aphanomyces euteiches TaxID=100861 RepID=A0A6G0XJ65_9STRA|nr:hypothetical protein Ae201684_004305 [Aphanomyces euteiches]KAH9144446.1 hypothetical protein AeRB84_011604 [Aphanomyces euteiches]
MPIQLEGPRHGKGRVRLLKVTRLPEKHLVSEIKAEILVEGSNQTAFLDGDNVAVLPTDTIKNTVHALAKKHDYGSIEEFAVILAKHYVLAHPSVIQHAKVKLVEVQWERLVVKDTHGALKPHRHAFVQSGTDSRYAIAEARLTSPGNVDVSLSAGLDGLRVLKTTESAFVGFFKDQYTTLPEVADRLLATAVSANWQYSHPNATSSEAAQVRAILLETFAGPADTGVPSPAVQYTLFKMGEAVLQRCPFVTKIHIYMPNIHNLPVNLAPFGLKNLHPHGEIFLPTDEPHGIIEATITRTETASRL